MAKPPTARASRARRAEPKGMARATSSWWDWRDSPGPAGARLKIRCGGSHPGPQAPQAVGVRRGRGLAQDSDTASSGLAPGGRVEAEEFVGGQLQIRGRHG